MSRVHHEPPLKAVWQGCMNVVQSEASEVAVPLRAKMLLFGLCMLTESSQRGRMLRHQRVVAGYGTRVWHNLELSRIAVWGNIAASIVIIVCLSIV